MNKALLSLSVGIMLIESAVYPHNVITASQTNLQNETAEISENEWISEDKIIYPVTPEDEEWDELYLMEDRVDICQLSDVAINAMTTYDLLRAVEQYPLLGTMYMYTDMQEGFDILVSQCNALKALLEREDCLSAVMSEYQSYEIPEKKTAYGIDEAVLSENPNYIIENKELLAVAIANARPKHICDLLEMIMLYKSDALTVEEQENIIELVIEKSEEKTLQRYMGMRRQARIFPISKSCRHTPLRQRTL